MSTSSVWRGARSPASRSRRTCSHRRSAIDSGNADRTRFPVVEVSIEVPFVALSRTIAAANTEGAQHRLVTHLGIFDTLRAAGGAGFPELLRRMEQLSGYRLFLCSPAVIHSSTASPRHRRRSPSTIFPGGPASPGHPGRLHRHDPARPSHGRPARRARPRRCGARRADGGPTHRDGRRARARQPRARTEVIRREGAETLAELLSGALDPPRRASGSRSRAWIRPPRRARRSRARRWRGRVCRASGLADRGVPHLLLSQRELYVLCRSMPPASSEIRRCSAGIGRGLLDRRGPRQRPT